MVQNQKLPKIMSIWRSGSFLDLASRVSFAPPLSPSPAQAQASGSVVPLRGGGEVHVFAIRVALSCSVAQSCLERCVSCYGRPLYKISMLGSGESELDLSRLPADSESCGVRSCVSDAFPALRNLQCRRLHFSLSNHSRPVASVSRFEKQCSTMLVNCCLHPQRFK